ncbi:MAG: hypothetical protein MJK08_12540 [Campylobacterales bacterium]|nr:hypothetical protein [Campylobacterales bacterium]
MNIEYKFLEKAINDKNFISFFYENKKYTNIKASKLENYSLTTSNGIFDFNKMKKIKILKERFNV